MKKFLSILFCLLVAAAIYANDTYFYMASGQLIPTKDGDVEIEMQEEVINLVLEEKYYEVTVDFNFFNHGDEINLEVGFPFFCLGIGGEGTISDFKCWTNDVETSFADVPLKKEWRTNEPTELENAYVRTINFPAKKVTKTRITYKTTYGREAPSGFIAKYLYGTGSSWKNSIGKMTVRIQNNFLLERPYNVVLPKDTPLKRINDNTWEGIYTNIEPKNYTDCITIELEDIFGDIGPRCLRKERYFACTNPITSKALFWYTKPQLRLLRNAIYAFYGYPFKSPDLIELFEKSCADAGWYDTRDWNGSEWTSYYPIDENFTEDKLTQLEKDNIKIILAEEKKR
ncbi:MAG: YARHG domain-containing protein [Treponema sp.]|nr:YARHG domain-containing protein [Treponema sp.]